MSSTPSTAWRNPRWVGLTCFACERPHPIERLATVCDACGLPLRVDYDLENPPARGVLAERGSTLWRYREVLPVRAGFEVSLSEGFTPLIAVEDRVWVKDEARNPTGSFKARGMSAAVSVAKAFGAPALRAPSAGNAAGALAAYGAAAGLPVIVAMPDDTPRAFVEECRLYGAEVVLVPGTISDAGKWLREQGPQEAFDVSTLREPHRIEGKKTMGYELWEQFDRLGGGLPDVVLYPTGGGTGLVGMWKAWEELRRLGWMAAPPPRLISVQVEGCAPVVSAYVAEESKTVPFPEPGHTCLGLACPRAARRVSLSARGARNRRDRDRGLRSRDGAGNSRPRPSQRPRHLPRRRGGLGGARRVARERCDPRAGSRGGLQYRHRLEVPLSRFTRSRKQQSGEARTEPRRSPSKKTNQVRAIRIRR